MDAWRSQGFVRFPPPWANGFGDGADAAAPDQGVPPPWNGNAGGADHGSPPSSYAVLDALDGKNGSILRLAGLTLLRGCFILPGLWVVGKVMRVDLDPYQLIGLSFGGSATITAGMLGYYWIRRQAS